MLFWQHSRRIAETKDRPLLVVERYPSKFMKYLINLQFFSRFSFIFYKMYFPKNVPTKT